MVSLPEIETAFKAAMLDVGVKTDEAIIADGKLHRVYGIGDKRGSKNIAYVLHIDGKPAGWWQYFKTGVTGTWSASGKREPMTAAMNKQIEYAKEVRAMELAELNQQAAEKARYIWEQATPITKASQHPYLVTKRIHPHGVRLYKGALVVAIYDEIGAILNLQFINADGSKRFLSGGKKKGCFSFIGKPTETLLLCEGWATGASLYEATGHYVIVAMDAGNLKPVAEIILRQYSNGKIIVCADNDSIGIEKATAAAFACGGLVIVPPLAGHDFNDFIIEGGVVI
jgi:putative DNA primase/helicase